MKNVELVKNIKKIIKNMKYADESKTVGKNGWTSWIFPNRKKYKMMCCDCGLVHNFQFRLSGKHIEFRVSRNERATGQSRRKLNKFYK